jgi:hypothetical protein
VTAPEAGVFSGKRVEFVDGVVVLLPEGKYGRCTPTCPGWWRARTLRYRSLAETGSSGVRELG